MSIFSWLFKKTKSDTSEPGQSDFRLIGSKGPGIKAVGTSHFQQEIQRIAGAKETYGRHDRLRVLLIEDPDNQHDKNAVKIVFQEEIIGYLPKAAAREYVQNLQQLGLTGKTGNASADIVGGWKDGESEGHFGLRLMFDTPLRTSENRRK